ncbi:DUF2515 family protein [Paenibacillus sp. IHBB 10380]|uniref:DUF2515 family protein n=1 Tax=Paenibacillus sp. IHBB 10380 TaxID=1566358 RepID=UPI0005CFA934|nr:DUF2515 family protein [Paenibacillus sp. IHBB 10380]AJS57402.1 hypothetical protein UB51_01635 [Paenibacillus sp. IHBB 10380]
MPDMHPTDPHRFTEIMSLVSTFPKNVTEVVKGKYTCWRLSRQFHKHRRSLRWNEQTAHIIRMQVQRATDDINRSHDNSLYKKDSSVQSLTEQDFSILQQIRDATTQANRSNMTRTKAYLACYEQYPELHWALLAHLVSRNGGWNMSDLKGELMKNLMTSSLRDDIYRMLERCNALIFQDAYPQLQLYIHSKRIGSSCFHLLPSFHISTFMTPFWNNFWIDRNSALLAVGLIINEQHYIEERVVKHNYFQKNIFQSSEYRMQHLAHINQILFPLGRSSRDEHNPDNTRQNTGPTYGLVGLVLENFSDIDERINLGKALYGLLFGYKDVLERVTTYALHTEHQGSRSEYWPQLFTTDKETALNSLHESSELLKYEWLPLEKRIYSPILNDVWYDMPYDPIPRYDWLRDKEELTQYITQPPRPLLIEMSHDHRNAIQKISLAHDIMGINK